MDTKQLEALRIAEWLEGIRGNTWPSYIPQEAAAELRRLHADNETLRCKLQTLEELGAACDDVQLLRLGYAAARQEIESLKAKNLELERVCDATYVTQGADAYNHACSMMEQYQAERKAARKEVGAESSLCDGISWLYTRIASLESQLEDVGTGGDVQPYDQQAMGLCHVCGWKGVIDYPDSPVCVACEHDKTLSPQPTAQALDAQRLTKASKDISTVLRVEGMDLEIGSRRLLREARDAIDAAIAAQKGNHD